MKSEYKQIVQFFLPLYLALLAGIAAAKFVYWLLTDEEL